MCENVEQTCTQTIFDNEECNSLGSKINNAGAYKCHCQEGWRGADMNGNLLALQTEVSITSETTGETMTQFYLSELGYLADGTGAKPRHVVVESAGCERNAPSGILDKCHSCDADINECLVLAFDAATNTFPSRSNSNPPSPACAAPAVCRNIQG